MAARFLALGDSYTIGESVPEAERWPTQLAAMLRAQGFELEPPQIIATTGWTTAELAEGIALARPEGPFELVSLLIGVNNQYRGLPLAEYGDEFAALLGQATVFAGGDARKVLVFSIPDWGLTPFAAGRDRARISRELDSFNASSERITREAGARYINTTVISRRAAEDPALTAADGLHPSGELYRQWAELALPQAVAALVVLPKQRAGG